MSQMYTHAFKTSSHCFVEIINCLNTSYRIVVSVAVPRKPLQYAYDTRNERTGG